MSFFVFIDICNLRIQNLMCVYICFILFPLLCYNYSFIYLYKGYASYIHISRGYVKHSFIYLHATNPLQRFENHCSKILVDFQWTTWYCIPEHRTLHVKITVFWNVMTCSLLPTFVGICYFHIQGRCICIDLYSTVQKMEGADSSQALMSVYTVLQEPTAFFSWIQGYS
jgi:hypothetical protein